MIIFFNERAFLFGGRQRDYIVFLRIVNDVNMKIDMVKFGSLRVIYHYFLISTF